MNVIGVYNNADVGKIVDQSVAGGESVDKGSEITISKSIGAKPAPRRSSGGKSSGGGGGSSGNSGGGGDEPSYDDDDDMIDFDNDPDIDVDWEEDEE